jgi:hypothetical protein
VAIGHHAAGGAEGGLDRCQGESIGQLDRTDPVWVKDTGGHTASRGMLWTMAWSLRMVSMYRLK